MHEELERVWAAHPDVPQRDRMRFTAAAMEIIGNIIEHATAHTGRSEITVQIALECSSERLRGVIVDDAVPVSVPLDTDMPHWAAESGCGLALARALTDELRWERLADGNRWTLSCVSSPTSS